MAKVEFNPKEMPAVKTAQTDTEDKSETFDNTKEKTNSKYLYDVKNGKKVSKKDAYKPNGEIKEQYKSYVTDTIASGKTGSGKKAKKVVEKVKDTIKNGQERNAVRADYSEASPDVKESLAKDTKASQKVIDEQVESIKNGEGFEGSKKVLTDTEEGKAFTSGEEIPDNVTDEDKENNFKQVETITSDPNVEQIASEMGLSPDNPPEDPSLAQEVGATELAKLGIDKDTVNSLVSAFTNIVPGKSKDVKSELADVLSKKKGELEELTKTGMGSKLAGILTVLSAVATIATGGTIPPINFNTVSAMISDPLGYKRASKEHAITEKMKDIESANQAVRDAERKDIRYKTDKKLVNQIMAENPGMTEDEAWQLLETRTKKSQSLTEEQINKDLDFARELVGRNFTSGDDARRQAAQYRDQAIQYRNAIKEIKSSDVDKCVSLMTSLVPTMASLSSTFSNAGSSSGKTLDGSVKTGALAKFVADANVNGGLSFSNSAQSGTTSANREGVAKADELYKKYLTETSGAKESLIKALEDAAQKADAMADAYEESAKNTDKNFSADKYAVTNPSSDTRKKHVYVSADNRSPKVCTGKHTYVPKDKR